MKNLPLFALLLAASTLSTFAAADIADSRCHAGPPKCRTLIVEDAGTCRQPDAGGTSCGGDAGTCAHVEQGCGQTGVLQCLGPKVEPNPPCSDGCAVAADSFGASQVGVPTLLFGIGAVAFLIDRRRRNRKTA